MELLQELREFFQLLEIGQWWALIVLLALIISALIPWRLEYKVEETKEKNGKKVYRIYHFKDK